MIPESLARLLSTVEKDSEAAVYELLEKVLASGNPKESALKATQVLAHEVASEAAVEAMFEAKRHVPGTGE